LPLVCDARRLGQALGNLVANAIKFTPPGGKVTVGAAPSGPEIRFSVTDTGPGNSEAGRAHVFERYWRGRQRDLTKGLGLGLFIAKGIVLAHGGTIQVASVLGKGSTFSFSIPTSPSG
jgi:signal transduction histidine kinase